MDHPRVAAVAVTLLLVFTPGCSSLVGGESTPDRDPFRVPPPTLTETPTQTPTPSPTPVPTIAPGISAEAVTSPLESMASHGIFLHDRSYHVTRTVNVRYPNGTTAETRTLEAWVSADRDTYLVARNDSSTGDRFAVYADGTSALSVSGLGEDASYDVVAPAGAEIPSPGGVLGLDLTFKGRLYRYLSAMEDVSVNAVPNESGVRRYQVGSSEVDVEDLGTIADGSVSNVSVVVVVGERGLIDLAWVIYQRVEDGTTVQVFERIEYEDVGETTVPVPEWVGAARNATDRDE